MNHEPRHIRYRAIPPAAFAALGMEQIAYVKPIAVNEVISFAVHAADGTQIAVLPNREVAMAAVAQHDLEPVSVH
jgi:hypothetical protein